MIPYTTKCNIIKWMNLSESYSWWIYLFVMLVGVL